MNSKIVKALKGNGSIEVSNPELFKNFMESLFAISPQSDTPVEMERYYVKIDGATWLDHLSNHLPREDWQQFPKLEVGD